MLPNQQAQPEREHGDGEASGHRGQAAALAPLVERVTHPALRVLADPGPLDRPLLIAAFSGAFGATGAAAVQYLVEHWAAQQFAAIDADPYYDFTVTRPVVRIEDGKRTLDWPENRVYLARPLGAGRDVVLLVGVEPHVRWRDYCAALLELVQALDIEDVLVVNAHRAPTPHTRPVPLRMTGADPEFAERFGLALSDPQYQGPTSISGVLLVELLDAGMRAHTLSAGAPFYVGVEPNPLAMLALVDTIDRGVGSRTDREALEQQVAMIEENARQSMAQSAELRAFVHNLEQRYDHTLQHAGGVQSATPGSATATLPGPEESGALLDEVERFLREQRGRGSGGYGRQRTH